jgi:hypothetical protein
MLENSLDSIADDPLKQEEAGDSNHQLREEGGIGVGGGSRRRAGFRRHGKLFAECDARCPGSRRKSPAAE